MGSKSMNPEGDNKKGMKLNLNAGEYKPKAFVPSGQQNNAYNPYDAQMGYNQNAYNNPYGGMYDPNQQMNYQNQNQNQMQNNMYQQQYQQNQFYGQYPQDQQNMGYNQNQYKSIPKPISTKSISTKFQYSKSTRSTNKTR